MSPCLLSPCWAAIRFAAVFCTHFTQNLDNHRAVRLLVTVWQWTFRGARSYSLGLKAWQTLQRLHNSCGGCARAKVGHTCDSCRANIYMFNCNNVDEWLHLAVYVPCYCRANDRCSVLFCKVLSRWALHDTQQCDMFWVAGFKNDSPEWALLHESRINAVRITGILKCMHVYILHLLERCISNSRFFCCFIPTWNKEHRCDRSGPTILLLCTCRDWLWHKCLVKMTEKKQLRSKVNQESNLGVGYKGYSRYHICTGHACPDHLP